MICFILVFVLPISCWLFLLVPAGVVEVVYVLFWIKWRGETKEMPKMHYRAFRRIERIAPEKWEPMSYLGSYGTETHILGTVHYDISGHCKVWETICMKTFPEALIFEIGYKRQYRKRKLDRKKNYVIERWKKDLEDYRNKADQDRLKAMTELRMECSSLSAEELESLKDVVRSFREPFDFRITDDDSGIRYMPTGPFGGDYGTDDN